MRKTIVIESAEPMASAEQMPPSTTEPDEAVCIQMLSYFQEEWRYRHQHFWKLLLLFFSFNLVITLLPFISGAFGVSWNFRSIPSVLFPVVGMGISALSYWILREEGRKLQAVAAAKYRINRSMKVLYQYEPYVPGKTDTMPKHLVFQLPLFMLGFQTVVELLSLACMISGRI